MNEEKRKRKDSNYHLSICRWMRTVCSFLLAVVLCFSVACGKGDSTSESQSELLSGELRESGDGTQTDSGSASGDKLAESDQTETNREAERETLSSPVKRIHESGTFSSQTGTHMNLYVDWVAESSDGIHVTFTLTGTLSCYSIEVHERPGMGKITVGKQSVAYSTNYMKHEENTKTSFELFSRSFSLTIDENENADVFQIPVCVTWPFNGVYSGTKISTVTAESVLTISLTNRD